MTNIESFRVGFLGPLSLVMKWVRLITLTIRLMSWKLILEKDYSASFKRLKQCGFGKPWINS